MMTNVRNLGGRFIRLKPSDTENSLAGRNETLGSKQNRRINMKTENAENSLNKGLSRRNFLGGVAGMGALAVAGLAGCSPKESDSGSSSSERTPEAGATTLGESTDWLGTAPEIAESDIVDTKTTDMLIIGAGNGGMAAAAYAAEQGVDFIVAEFGESVGATRHWFAAIDTEPFTSQGITVDRQRLLGEIIRYSSGNCDQRLIKMWMDESNEMFEFVDKHMSTQGMKVEADEFEMPGGMGGTDFYTPPFEHHYVQENGEMFGGAERNVVFEEAIKEKGHEVLFGHSLVKLIREENGPVTGAIFETSDGYIQINANKGVLLATGGYPANPEMLSALSPITAKSVTALGYNQNDKGQGIKAAMWAGAAKDLASATMIFDRGLVAPGTKAGYTEESIAAGNPQFPSNGQFNPGTQPFLKVNLKGERFANESADYDYLPHAAAYQPNGVYCSICDGNFVEDVKRFHTLGCSAMTRNMAEMLIEEGGQFEAIEEGTLQRADTLEELAEKLGLPVDTFLATVERYNELAEKGEDEDFGKESYRLSTLKTPPFYGATLGGTLLTTIDGIRINHKTEAIDTEGNVIEGLYAAGDCSGSVFSGNYPDQLHGFACGRTMTEAIHAVKEVAAK